MTNNPSKSSVSKEPERIQSMFGSIAPVYDLLNHAFSMNIDTMWRNYTAKCAIKPTDRDILDVACGTGDLTIALRKRAASRAKVIGADFCLPMLEVAARKDNAPFLQADGLRLPFPDESFDLLTIGFGLRNMTDLETGLREMRRVLRPGGRLAVLEFTMPTNPLFRAGYLFYFRRFLPLIGRIVSGASAYGYLCKSVMEWPQPRALARIMKKCGYRRVRFSELSFGIAVLHIAERGD